jgi:hypothetical protein
MLKKLKIELPQSFYTTPRHISEGMKTTYSQDTCTLMFIAALFTIAKLWNQPRCPSNNEWIKKIGHIYTIMYYSIIKKREVMLEKGWNWRSSC